MSTNKPSQYSLPFESSVKPSHCCQSGNIILFFFRQNSQEPMTSPIKSSRCCESGSIDLVRQKIKEAGRVLRWTQFGLV